MSKTLTTLESLQLLKKAGWPVEIREAPFEWSVAKLSVHGYETSYPIILPLPEPDNADYKDTWTDIALLLYWLRYHALQRDYSLTVARVQSDNTDQQEKWSARMARVVGGNFKMDTLYRRVKDTELDAALASCVALAKAEMEEHGQHTS